MSAAPSVLVVDDEAAICLLLSEALRDAGFKVADAVCEAEAVAALDAGVAGIRVLVTDINVGVRGWGFGFARQARARNGSMMVVYITGDSEADVATNGVAGATVLPKPFTPEDLIRHINGLLPTTA